MQTTKRITTIHATEALAIAEAAAKAEFGPSAHAIWPARVEPQTGSAPKAAAMRARVAAGQPVPYLVTIEFDLMEAVAADQARRGIKVELCDQCGHNVRLFDAGCGCCQDGESHGDFDPDATVPAR